MPVQIDPQTTRGIQKLDTVVFQTVPGQLTVARFKPISLAVTWVISFFTSTSTSAFTVSLCRDDPLSVIDTENVGAGGFNTQNFPDFMAFPGSTMIAVIQPVGVVQTIAIDLWGHAIPIKY